MFRRFPEKELYPHYGVELHSIAVIPGKAAVQNIFPHHLRNPEVLSNLYYVQRSESDMIRTLCDSAHHILSYPEIYLAEMPCEDYRRGLPLLRGASVGAHTRHILDGFLCLFLRMPNGAVCYHRRERDPLLENDPETALSRLNDLRAELASLRTAPDRAIQVEADDLSAGLRISSTLGRELLHNIDHAVHHLAIIRIAIESEFPDIGLPEDFGVAPSTIRYREQLNAMSG